MKLKTRLITYLRKRQEPVEKSELLKVTKAAGITSKEMSTILFFLDTDNELITIASWYGYKADTGFQKGARKQWYQYVPFTKTEIAQMIDDRRWFNSL